MQSKNLLLLLSLLLGNCLFGQNQLPANLADSLPTPAIWTLPTPDYAAWQRADAPYGNALFARAIPIDGSPATRGNWTDLPDGSRLWQLQITVPEAHGLAVFFDRWQLPAGARLWAYAPRGPKNLGPYRASDAAESKRFWLGFTPGADIVLAYQAPAGSTDTPFHLWRVDAVYRPEVFNESLMTTGFGASDPCHRNINCPDQEAYDPDQPSVARIRVIVEEGTGYCTGTLINNTANDGTPYLLTAFHCMDGYTPLYDMWRFDFGYESPSCDNPIEEPDYRSVLGCTLRAGRRQNDFLLLELNGDAAAVMDLHFLGWDRSGVPPDYAGVIHHPVGDIQKLALSNTSATVHTNAINWNNEVTTPALHHYRVTYHQGTIQLGSSGAALLDPNHRIVGQLHGDANITDCDATVGYFGRLSLAWEGGGTPETRLRDWLDPVQSAPLIADRLVLDEPGRVYTEAGDPLPGVRAVFSLNGMPIDTQITDDSGLITPPQGLAPMGILSLTLERPDDFDNGVTVTDITRIQRQVLTTDTLDSPYQLLAADVNQSLSVTTLDIIRIRKVILTVDPDFGDGGAPAWLFYPGDFAFAHPYEPWLDGPPQNTFTYDLGEAPPALPDFVAIKSGDVNGSAQIE